MAGSRERRKFSLVFLFLFCAEFCGVLLCLASMIAALNRTINQIIPNTVLFLVLVLCRSPSDKRR